MPCQALHRHDGHREHAHRYRAVGGAVSHFVVQHRSEDRPDDVTDPHGRLDGGHGRLLLGEYQRREGVVPRGDHRVECTEEELDNG